ncbi:aldehyde dehydrogenase 3H1 [Actinidia rufa]|uniref:aldehyde dehydrogenase (NAD(+)) n=1 Tax=Actinidia rufa TaxID=165716 RepID=A0A7J0DS05_9ERIC|nr:aldehyde dehydrogenase 3H1 [Actinidia rufa]
MASEDKKPKAACFDGEAARSLVTELRKTITRMTSIEALRTDLSKPVLEAFVSEIAMLKSSCEFTLKQLKRWMVPEKVKTSITTFPSSAEIVPEPLGVVLVISAWNYPFLLSLDPVIGAIAAGNAVVLKPSEIAPATSSLLAKLLGEYMDSSAVKVIEGAVPETSALLEQKWDKIFYTGCGFSTSGCHYEVGDGQLMCQSSPSSGVDGSRKISFVGSKLEREFFWPRVLETFNTVDGDREEEGFGCIELLAVLLNWLVLPSEHAGHEGGCEVKSHIAWELNIKPCFVGNGKVGRIVLAAAAKHLTPVGLELGGKCPVIVDSNINLIVTARRIIAGKWGMNNGQACISADHIITTKDFAPKLIDALKVELVKFYGNEPLVSEDLSRIVSSNHFARVTKLLDDDKVAGKIVHGGQKDQNNLKIAPTILLDVPEDCLMMNEEIFGPLLPIVTVNNLEDSFNIINSREKPLAAYLFTTNKRLKEAFVKNVTAGGLLINDIALHIANPYLPFGGVGESGMGSYHGRFSFDTFTHKKAVLYRSFAGDASARYPPYTPGKLKLLKALLSGNILGIIRALLGW